MTRYDAPNAGETPNGCWEAEKLAPVKPRPKTRAGAVAVVEPDDE